MISRAAVAAAIATLVAQTVTAVPLSVPEVETKIVGGDAVRDRTYPFVVSLLSRGQHFCGGSLLNENFVLTASHCLFNPPPNIQVRAGSNDRTTGGVVVTASNLTTHPGFTMEKLDNDVALLRLEKPIKKSTTIGYVPLPQKGSDPEEGTKTVIGWGLERDGALQAPKNLRQVNVTLLRRDQCVGLFGQEFTENMICAGDQGKDSCQGDSGGPLIDAKTGVLQGIVSFGIGCANPRLPGVYARVDSQLKFIREIMKQDQVPGQSPTQPGPPSEPTSVSPGTPAETTSVSPDDTNDNGGNIPSTPGGGIYPGEIFPEDPDGGISPEDPDGGIPPVIPPVTPGGGTPPFTPGGETPPVTPGGETPVPGGEIYPGDAFPESDGNLKGIIESIVAGS